VDDAWHPRGDRHDDHDAVVFAEGSDCRACVEGNGGDYAGCQDAGSCPEQAPLAIWALDAYGEQAWYRGVYSLAFGCAPDYLAQFYFMASYGEDGVLPDAYNHDAWAYLCTPLWNDETDAVDTFCIGSEDPVQRGVLAEGVFGYVDYIRPVGSDVLAWRGRQYYVDEVQLDNGASLSWFYGSNPGLGALSAPRVIADTNGDGVAGPGDDDYGFGAGGFGLNPHEQRPDGDLLARDWLATAAMKTSTTREGIPIFPYQRNRCGAWAGPADDGTYRCTDVVEPEGDWINDVYTTWADAETRVQAQSFPLTTLGSTGLMDDDVPGGVVVHLAGSTTLASPAWDACEMPHLFEPDATSHEDVPGDYGGPAALDGQTWRFDKPDADLRVVLNTNQARGWCGGTETGGSRSVLDEGF